MRIRIHRLIASGRDRGASAVEYGLMVAAIAAVIVGVVFGLGHVVGTVFNNTCSEIGINALPQGNADCPTIDE